MPVVSVVIPCLNQAHYLHAALRSVEVQNESVETIVVDDGSTDETAHVAAAAGATLLRQAQAGVSAARNAGLRAARGAYIIFLDADDELAPDAVRSGIEMLNRYPDVWMVGRACVLIDHHGRTLPTSWMPPASDDLYGEWLERNLVWTPGAAIFRRAPLEALGGFPAGVGPAADYAVYLRLAGANRVVIDPRVAVRYRQHAGNMSRDASRMLRATLAVLRREEQRIQPRHLARYRRGLSAWRTFYGEQVIQQLRADLRAGRFGRPQMEDIILLVRECPGLVLMHLGRKLRRVAGGHPPSDIEPGRFAASDGSTEGRVGTAGGRG